MHLALKGRNEFEPWFNKPQYIMTEVKDIVRVMFPHFDFDSVLRPYVDVKHLFSGQYPGYRKCNTFYHDWQHTEDCLLATVRLIHGAQLNGYDFSERGVRLGIIAALMHDTGYIQKLNDRKGTGAKYTRIHVVRSINFMKTYFAHHGYTREDFHFCRNCLQCTGIEVDIETINFESSENEIIGKILGTGDLVGQMSDANYLEKLPILYQEFLESGISNYKSEVDFLEKTFDFWETTKRRFVTELGGVNGYSRAHFKARWGIDRELDTEAIEWNMARLKNILELQPKNGSQYLRLLKGLNLPQKKSPIDKGKLLESEVNGPNSLVPKSFQV